MAFCFFHVIVECLFQLGASYRFGDFWQRLEKGVLSPVNVLQRVLKSFLECLHFDVLYKQQHPSDLRGTWQCADNVWL